MKRGLVIGKFLPPHAGHVALINFAAQRCDELIVSISDAKTDTIDPQLRLSWLKSIFKDRPNIKFFLIEDDFDHPELALPERTRIWADRMREVYPAFDSLFTSEEYGESFAKNLNAKHVPFDHDRKQFPVSASQIRKSPFQFWEFIPAIAKPYFIKKICFYGAESTGKSVMAQKMAEKYNTVFVPEVAREMISSNVFNREDIIAIGREQTARVYQQVKNANKILFCDTDVITTQVYSRHYLKVVPPVLYEFERMVQYDLYFLFEIDTEWVADNLRDLGSVEDRKNMHAIFKDELDRRKIHYITVQGNWEERERIVSQAIDLILSQ